MTMIIKGNKDDIRELRDLAEEKNVEIVLYSEKRDFPIFPEQENVPTESLTGSILKTFNAVEKLYANHGRGVTTEEVAIELSLSKNLVSNYLNQTHDKGLIRKIPNVDYNEINARYLFEPTNQ